MRISIYLYLLAAFNLLGPSVQAQDFVCSGITPLLSAKSISYKKEGQTEFTPATDLCVTFYQSGPSFIGGYLNLVSPYGGEQSSVYPAGTVFRITYEENTTLEFGAAVLIAGSARAYREEEASLKSTITVEGSSIPFTLHSDFPTCSPGTKYSVNAGMGILLQLIDPATATDYDKDIRNSIFALRTQNFGVPALSASGAISFYLGACEQPASPALFAKGFIPISTLTDITGLTPEILNALTDEQLLAAFSVNNFDNLPDLAFSIRKSFGEEMSENGEPVSELPVGYHVEITAGINNAVLSNKDISDKTIGTGLGLTPAAKTAIKSCSTKQGTLKKKHKFLKKKSALTCKKPKKKKK